MKSLVWVDGAQSFRSCVKYYPSAGTEVISDHFEYCVLWRNWGGCLSGWTKVYCVAREGSSYLDDEHLRYMTLLALTIGQEDVADLFYVTKAYHGD